MNLRFRGICTLSLLLTLAAFSAARAARAQMPDTPPMKMGLWQTESTTTMTGMENSPAGAHMGGDHNSVSQSCMTPERWKEDVLKMQQRQQRAECTQSNMHMDAHGMSVDETCGNAQYATKMHFEATFEGNELMHGTGAMHMTGPAFPQGMDMHMRMTSHFVSSDCGDVKPGQNKMIH